jgi:hypothetical protein
VADAAADIDEKCFVGLRAPRINLFLEREDGEPVPLADNLHYLLEMGKALGLAGEPGESGEVRIECFLERGLAVVSGVLVLCLCQVVRELLKGGANKIKAGRTAGLVVCSIVIVQDHETDMW